MAPIICSSIVISSAMMANPYLSEAKVVRKDGFLFLMYTAVSAIWIGERISTECYISDLSPVTLHDIAVAFSIDAFLEL